MARPKLMLQYFNVSETNQAQVKNPAKKPIKIQINIGSQLKVHKISRHKAQKPPTQQHMANTHASQLVRYTITGIVKNSHQGKSLHSLRPDPRIPCAFHFFVDFKRACSTASQKGVLIARITHSLVDTSDASISSQRCFTFVAMPILSRLGAALVRPR
jgi:hypothetical protein